MLFSVLVLVVVFFKQKTAYEMRISDWSSDVCSSDVAHHEDRRHGSQSQDERIVLLLQPRDCGKEADDYDDDRRKPQNAPADLSERVGCHESLPLQKEWLRGRRTGPKRMEQAPGGLHCKLFKMNS